MDVEVQGSALRAPEVRKLVRAAVEAESGQLSRVSVSFVEKQTIQELNRKHRGKDRATDVLSYPFDESFPQGSGGEVIVCPAVVGRIAKQDGRSTASALRETVVHGVLHLLGHKDDTESGARGMDRLTRRILEAA